MVDEIADGITLQFFDDGSIAHFMIGRVDGNRPDRLSAAVLDLLHDWPPGRPIKLIYDLSISGASLALVQLFGDVSVGVTPEGVEAVNAFKANNPKSTIYLATVLPKSISGRRAERKVDKHRVDQQFEGVVVFKRDDALEWLRTVGG
ncbi:MAG: hypothetical protein GYB68_00995 [Chloroflexi bacterium]|nr:hypothetical protein [Chloroflexota bacterium]